MEKKQVSKGLKWIFQLIESKKLGNAAEMDLNQSVSMNSP